MSRGKKRVIKAPKKYRMTRKYKREVLADLMSHFRNYYSHLTRVQIRRILSHGYQMLREGKR